MSAPLFPDDTPPTPATPLPTARGKSFILQFDGGPRRNPGPAGIGVTLTDERGTPVYELSEFLGVCTNNIAEYTALVRGLTAAKALGAGKVTVRSDSELLVRQINGVYRVKNPGIKPLYQQAVDLMRAIGDVKVSHVYREGNSRADELANLAMDSRKKTETRGTVKSTAPQTSPMKAQELSATFQNGVFKPEQTPTLPNGTRVRLLVIPLEG